MRKLNIEKEWEYKGYLCRVNISPMGFRCGYVYLPKEHSLYGKTYDELDIDCHGGLTYCAEQEGKWCIGYDCGHCGDAEDVSLMEEEYRKILGLFPRDTDGIIRDLDYCIGECQGIVDQVEKDCT